MNLKEIGLGLAIVVALVVGVLSLNKPLTVNVQIPEPLGATTEETVVRNFLAGVRVGPTSRAVITQQHCVSVSTDLPSITGNSTTTFDLVFAGVDVAQNQTYSLGFATTTAAARLLQFTGKATTTAGTLNVLVENLGGTLDLGAGPLNACYTQF